MQLAKGAGRRHKNPPPNHRTDLEQPYLELQQRRGIFSRAGGILSTLIWTAAPHADSLSRLRHPTLPYAPRTRPQRRNADRLLDGRGEVVRYLSRYGVSRVSKAVLVSAVTPYLLKTIDNPDGVDPKVFEEIKENLRKDRPAFLSDFGPKFYGRSVVHHTVSEPVLEWTQSMALMGSLRSTLQTAKSWSSTDFREEMKGITIPVLVIHGTSDNTVPIDASGQRSVKILPNATITEYDGEPHGLFLTAADRLNEELLQFVGGPREPISAPVLS